MAGSARTVVVGGLVGYVASRTMDAATGWFFGRQSDASKQREEELAPGGTLVQLGHQLAGTARREVDDEAAGRVGLRAHRTLGVLYGIIAAFLVRRGVAPLRAGLTVGAGAFVLVDEGTAITQVTDYPVESHVRGVVGHGTLGTVIGVLLTFVGDPRGA